MDSGLIGAVLSLENDRERRPEILISAMGTWSPAFVGTGVAGTFTYTVQQGYYTLIGDRMFINGRIAISAIAVNPTGSMQITGQPGQASADANSYNVIDFITSSLDFDAGFTFAKGEIDPGGTTIFIAECGDNASYAILQGGTFDNNPAVDIIFSGSYKI